jgi:N-acetyl-anhydromuramyl-L-alanine amidase AmpD
MFGLLISSSNIPCDTIGNPNQWTISIEHEGFSTNDFTAAQYTTTAKLLKYLDDEWNIPLDSTHVIRHREINGGKTCPGVVNVEWIIRQARLL